MINLILTVKNNDNIVEDIFFKKDNVCDAMQFVREFRSDKYKIISKPLIEVIHNNQ